MPRYHFNVHDGASLPDDNGTDLPDIATARSMAVNLAGSLLREQSAAFWQGEDWQMDVTDERGLVLFALAFTATHAPGVGSAVAR